MAPVESLNELLIGELRDMYDAEQRLTKAIPALIEAATNADLIGALDKHLDETRTHVIRIAQAFAALDEEPEAKTCDGMKGLISEGDKHAGKDYDDPSLRDAAIIGSAQRVEHYEIAAYGTAIAHARLLGEEEVVKLLEITLAEEKAADLTLTDVAERSVKVDASSNTATAHEGRPTT